MIQLATSFFVVAMFTITKSGFTISVDINQWKWIIILGLFNTGIGCYFYFSSILDLPVQTVVIYGYLEPFFDFYVMVLTSS